MLALETNLLGVRAKLSVEKIPRCASSGLSRVSWISVAENVERGMFRSCGRARSGRGRLDNIVLLKSYRICKRVLCLRLISRSTWNEMSPRPAVNSGFSLLRSIEKLVNELHCEPTKWGWV